jgi:hypothetical protein
MAALISPRRPASLGRALEALQGIRRAVPQFQPKERAENDASPARGKDEIAMVVHATMTVVERNAIQVLMNGDGEGQSPYELELVRRRVHAREPEGDLEVEPTRS